MPRAEPADAPPRQRDPARSQAAILAAARAEFSERGFEGARIEAIADRAGMNKRMLYHYFGDKEALYRTVLREAYVEIRAGERELSLDRLVPVAAVEALVRFTFRHFLEKPWFVQILTNENLLGARFLKTLPDVQDLHSPFVAELARILARGEAEGVFRPGVDPVQLYISVAALGYFYVSNMATLSVIFDADLRAPDRLAARADHAVEVVLSYLRKP